MVKERGYDKEWVIRREGEGKGRGMEMVKDREYSKGKRVT